MPWLWLTSEQMGFPLKPTGGGEHEERAEDLDSSQGVRDHLVAYHLAPAITDFISDEIRVCCNNDLEQTLTLLHSEWSKEIKPSGQSSTHHPLVVSNPIDKKGSEFMRRSMRWEVPSKRGMELSKKSGVLGRPRASADYNYSERDETNRRVGGS